MFVFWHGPEGTVIREHVQADSIASEIASEDVTFDGGKKKIHEQYYFDTYRTRRELTSQFCDPRV